MRIPFLGKKKKKKVEPPIIDISHLATKDDILSLSKEQREDRKRIIMDRLSPRERERLEKIMERKRQEKHDKR